MLSGSTVSAILLSRSTIVVVVVVVVVRRNIVFDIIARKLRWYLPSEIQIGYGMRQNN